MPLLSFLFVLALPPFMLLVPSLGQSGDASPTGISDVGMILIVEGVLVVGYALSRLERRRLVHNRVVPQKVDRTASEPVPRRNPLFAAH